MPPADGNANGDRFARFSSSTVARESKTLFRKLLESRGYALAPLPTGSPDLRNLAVRRELSRFNVLASAKSVLLGELILASLGEHISDRTRLEILNETAAQFNGLSMPVNEELELLIIEAKS